MRLDRQRKVGITLLILAVFVTTLLAASRESLSDITGYEKNPAVVLVPREGQIYHAASPDIWSGWHGADDPRAVEKFEEVVGKDIVWASVSNTWFKPNESLPCTNTRHLEDQGIHFPAQDVEKALRAGVVPSIRMFPYDRCIRLDYEPYKLEHFIAGEYDEELRAWAQAAKEVPSPLLVTFGLEVNGSWFPWNLRHNGGLEKTEYGSDLLYDGHERFRDTYRHIIDIFREEGVENVTWIYHVNCMWPGDEGNPETSADGYYPGDDYIDWIGVSCYGSQNPENDFWWEMEHTLGIVYEAIEDSEVISSEKPIALMEYGVTQTPQKAEWMRNFFEDLVSGRYPRIRAVGWWQSDFCVVYSEEGGCEIMTDIRVNSSPEALEVYKDYILRDIFTGVPVFEPRATKAE